MRPLLLRLAPPRAKTRVPTRPIHIRTFTSTPPRSAKNRIYDPVRTPADLSTLLLLHSTRRAPLLTLWSASWCRACARAAPLLRALVRDEHAGLAHGGVGFVEVRLDASPDMADLAAQHAVARVPTLLAFSRGEPQLDTRLVSAEQLSDVEGLRAWIEREARRAGDGGAGGRWLRGWFGG